MSINDDISEVEIGDWTIPHGASSSLLLTAFNGLVFYTAMLLPKMVVAGLRTNVTVAGSAGAVLRVGLCNILTPSLWKPGTLIVDAGALPSESIGALTWPNRHGLLTTGVAGAFPSNLTPNSETSVGPAIAVLAGDPKNVRPI